MAKSVCLSINILPVLIFFGVSSTSMSISNENIGWRVLLAILRLTTSVHFSWIENYFHSSLVNSFKKKERKNQFFFRRTKCSLRHLTKWWFKRTKNCTQNLFSLFSNFVNLFMSTIYKLLQFDRIIFGSTAVFYSNSFAQRNSLNIHMKFICFSVIY